MTLHVDDDGMVALRGRLTPEIGGVVQRALEAAADRLFREAAASPTGNGMADDVTPAQRRADALGLLAECALNADLDRGSTGDRYQVVLHVDATALQSSGEREIGSSATSGSGQAVVELNDSATNVSAETSRRIACDAAPLVMRHAADGSVLDVGRRRRTIPPAIRRALLARDRHCQFPGCTARRCDGHHIQHWADGGPTRLDNLALLCRRHHRAVHEGRFTMVPRDDGTPMFLRPDGTCVETAPATHRADVAAARGDVTAAPLVAPGIAIGPYTAMAHGDQRPLDLVWALDIVRGRAIPDSKDWTACVREHNRIANASPRA